MYKIYKNSFGQNNIMRFNVDESTTSFGQYLANTDYQQFKKDIMAGGELQDADGVVMSADAAKAFVATLP